MKKIAVCAALFAVAMISGQAVHAADHNLSFKCIDINDNKTVVDVIADGNDTSFTSIKAGKVYFNEYVGKRQGKGFVQHYFHNKDRGLEANLVVSDDAQNVGLIVTEIGGQEPIIAAQCQSTDYQVSK